MSAIGARVKIGAPGLLGMTTLQMKDLLKKAGYPVSGTREVLGNRILDNNLLSEEPIIPIPKSTFSIPDITETKLVNVKVAYLRPQYENLKEWCSDDNNVYIGRDGVVFIEIDGRKQRYPEQSKWHNPFPVKKYGDQAVPMFEDYIRKSPLLQDIEELRGKTLGCWCVEPGRTDIVCHGHVLIKILNELVGK